MRRQASWFGVPDEVRGAAWLRMVGLRDADACDAVWRGTAAVAVVAAASKEDALVAVAKDLERTFPDHVLFATPTGRAELAWVLKTHAMVVDPEVGYGQGMAFLAAFLLSYMPPREALAALHALLTTKGMGDLFRPPLMVKFKPALEELARLVDIVLPDVAAKFQDLGVEPSLYASQWILTLFSLNFPQPFVARVWDAFFASGSKSWETLFRVALSLLHEVRADIMDPAADFEDVVRVFRELPAHAAVNTPEGVAGVMARAWRLNVAECDVRVLSPVL